MSQTIATAICETNKKAGLSQENVFLNGTFRQPSEYSVPYIKNIRSASPVQIFGIFSAQGKDSVSAMTLKKVLDQFTTIANSYQNAKDMSFDSFSDQTVTQLNDLVCRVSFENKGHPVRISMTVIVIKDDEVRVMSLGNTRAYLYRKSRFIALSEDQTVAHRYVQMGAISKDEEQNHPERSVLTQYLGRFPQDGPVIPEKKIHFKLLEGDEFFLFGTGISHMVEPPVLGITAAKTVLPNVKSAEFISSAKQSGAQGGLTVISIKVERLMAIPAAAVAAATSSSLPSQDDQEHEDSEEVLEQEEQSVLSAKDRRKRRLKKILVPIGVLICCYILGYFSMFVLMNSGRWFANDSQIEGTVDQDALYNRVMYVLGDHIPVYARDDLESPILAYLNRGDAVMLLSDTNAFSRILMDNGMEGYIVSVMLSDTDPTIGEAIPTMEADPTPIPTEATVAPTETTAMPIETTVAPTSEETTPIETTEETTTAETTPESTISPEPSPSEESVPSPEPTEGSTPDETEVEDNGGDDNGIDE